MPRQLRPLSTPAGGGRVASATATQSPFAIDGLFETASSDFWVKGRTALTSTGGSALNGSFDEARFGGCLTYDLSRRKSLQANLGYPTEYATTTRGAAAAASTAARRLVFVH
jgi:hypothetical protein